MEAPRPMACPLRPGTESNVNNLVAAPLVPKALSTQCDAMLPTAEGKVRSDTNVGLRIGCRDVARLPPIKVVRDSFRCEPREQSAADGVRRADGTTRKPHDSV